MSKHTTKGRCSSPAAVAAARQQASAGTQAQPPPSAGSAFSAGQKAVLLIALTVVYAVAGTWGQFDFGDMMGYYTMGADAALKGNLYLDYTPDKVNLIDMIPYQGRYYLQWGPFPLLFHVPARLMGWNLSDRVACLGAGLLSAFLFFEILLQLQRR